MEQHKQKIGNVNEITQKKRLQLREWCEEQRVQAARLKWGKESDITDEQINKLTDLGFEWDTVNSPSKGWDDFYGELLIQFIKKKSWDFLSEPGDIKDWAEKQRGEYRKFVHDIPSLLIADQVQKLHAVNFPWQVKYNSKQTAKSWEEMFGELLAFKIKHGHINVDHNNFELYNWKARQREEQEKIQKKSAKKRSAIIEERVRKLTDIGFDWDGPRITLGKGNRGNMDVPLPMMTAQIPLAMPAFAVVPWPNAFPGPAPMTTVATAPAPTSVYPVVQNQAQNSKDLANEAAQVVANLNARNKEAPSKVAGRQEQKSTRTDETTEPWA